MKKGCFMAVLTVVFLILLAGCDFWQGLITKDGETKYAAKPYETSKPILLRTTPEKIIQEEGWEIRTQIPKEKLASLPKIKLGINPVSPMEKNTIKKLQEMMKPEQTLFLTDSWTPMYVKGRSGKNVAVLIPANTILLCKVSHEKDRQVLTPVIIPYCWNEVSGTQFIKKDKIVLREKILQSSERYRDIKVKIDYTPALWIGLAALVAGGIFSWFIRPSRSSRFFTQKK